VVHSPTGSMANVWEMSTSPKPHWGTAPLPLPSRDCQGTQANFITLSAARFISYRVDKVLTMLRTIHGRAAMSAAVSIYACGETHSRRMTSCQLAQLLLLVAAHLRRSVAQTPINNATASPSQRTCGQFFYEANSVKNPSPLQTRSLALCSW